MPRPQVSAALSFSGRPREFLGLMVKGSLLQIPTFGFYRFWLVTKVRRHLWTHTRLAGESFEYTGTAKELLVGFLIALAVLVPIYIGYFLVGLMAEERKAFLSMPLAVLMYALAQFARYRAFRYRASRTILRGIRFWVSGSGWRYAAIKLQWNVLTGLTLGLVLPWAYAAEERYRMQHLHWGTLTGDFAGTGKDLFRRAWWIWAYLVFGCGGALVLAGIYLKERAKTDPVVYALPVLILLAVLPAYPIFLAILSRWRVEGIRIGRVSLACGLRKREMVVLFSKLLAASVGLLACAAAALVGVIWLLGRTGTVGEKLGTASILTTGVAALLILLALGVVQRYFLSRGFWAVIASSIAVVNADALDEAAAAGQPSSSLGEGLADALDFGGGF